MGFILCRNVSCGLPEIRQMKERKIVRFPRQRASSQYGIGVGSQVREMGAVCGGQL